MGLLSGRRFIVTHGSATGSRRFCWRSLTITNPLWLAAAVTVPMVAFFLVVGAAYAGTLGLASDVTPPITSVLPAPSTPDGNDGWFRGGLQIALEADEPALTYFSWDSPTGPWMLYSTPVSPPFDGDFGLFCYSMDPSGNTGMVHSQSGKVDSQPPSTPSTPTASASSPTSVTLAWNSTIDLTSGLAHYEVRNFGSLIGTSPVNSMALSSLATETAYSLTVTAVDVAGNESEESSAVAVSTLAETPRPPAAVHARTVQGRGAYVNWGESTGTVAPVSYRIWRASGAGPFSAVATLTGQSARSYADTQAPVLGALRYRVSVVDARAEGDQSAVTTLAAMAAADIAPVVGLSAKNTASVLITWTPSAVPGVTGYHVYRSTTSTDVGTTLTVTPVVLPSYHDTATADYTEYWYRISAVDGAANVGTRSAAEYIRTEAGSGTVEAPHGSYSQDTDMCALCHSTHTSTSPISLLKGTTTDEAPLCFNCHDGTSASDVMGEYTSLSTLSRHAVSVGSVTGALRCSGCHGVHSAEQTDTVSGLLRAGSSKSGNGYCYECHGSTAGANPRGDLRVFEGSSHAAGVNEPPTGTKVVCLSCHVSHASADPSLYPYAPDDRCIGCHSAGSASGDIAAALSGPGSDTRHDLRSADSSATGSRLACGNCHEPHTSTATTPCIDPDRPTTAGGMVAGDALCLRCHDNALPTSVDTSGWVSAPLAPGGEPTTTDLTGSWAASFHATATSVDPQLRADMGYAKGDTLTCRSCHDTHGSANRFTLRESVSAKVGTSTVDALLVVPLAGGGADLRFFCASCHVVGPATHPDAGAGGADLSVWPLDCSAGGCHTHAGTGL